MTSFSRNDSLGRALALTVLIAIAAPIGAPLALAADYDAEVRVFIVEPKSRWSDAIGIQYDYGFLDFALIDELVVPEKEAVTTTSVWDPAAAGFGDILLDNLMAIAVVFDRGNPHVAYAQPPDGDAFTAYYADAALSALPGETVRSAPAGSFTHTVWVEEGSSTG